MAVLPTVRDYSYNLYDLGLEPGMFSFKDNGAYECATWWQGPCTGTTVSIILGDHGGRTCTAAGCELGFSRSACYNANSVSTTTCSMAYSEIGMSPSENWAYTNYTTASDKYSFGTALAHEMGHSASLAHSGVSHTGKVMQCALAPGETMYPNLDGDTIAGIGFAYGRYAQTAYGTAYLPPC
jgi:hypothetical protein